MLILDRINIIINNLKLKIMAKKQATVMQLHLLQVLERTMEKRPLTASEKSTLQRLRREIG